MSGLVLDAGAAEHSGLAHADGLDQALRVSAAIAAIGAVTVRGRRPIIEQPTTASELVGSGDGSAAHLSTDR